MNKIFKVIWNPATGNYTVTSETAKSRGKKSGRSKLLISALVAGGMLSSFGALANAGNDNGQGVDYGSGSAGDGWVAIGKGAKANTFMNTSGSSTAVGYDAIAEGQYSSAIGSKTHAIGGASMAFGVSAISEGDRSIALGASSYSLGQYSMALGRYSKALGKLSIAMGDSSKAEGANAIALGNATKATEIMSIALGDTANASKAYSMALGASSVASEENAIAIGAETEAAENATAIGNNAKAKGTNSMAMGFGSLADKVNTIALGNGSQALADNAIAIGQGNKADGVDAIALGNGSQSRGLNTIALGTASNATGDKSLALGSNSSANGINSVALGADSIADLDNTVSVGNSSLKRKIVNVKNGAIKSDSYDAINGSQLYAISDSVAKRLGGGAAVDVDDGTVTAPTYNLKNGSKNNVGAALAVLDENTLQWDQTKGKYSAAHGTSSPTASVITDVADGTISASSKDAVNGSQLKATNDDVEANTANIATNTSNIATNTANIATNTTNITNLTDSVGDLQADALLWNETKKAFSAAHGQDTTSKITNVKDADLTADSTDAVNGSQLKTTNDAVATNTTNIATNTTNISNLTETVTNLGEDALKWDKDNGVFTAAHGNNTASKITNILDGTVTATSSDAINGSQLYDLSSNIATYFGGNASVNTDGVFTGPTYKIGETNYYNVGDALAAINSSFSTSLGDALLWDATAGKFSAKHGTNGDASVITDVADGEISDSSSDAVNGSQLHGVSSYVVDALGGGAEVNADGTITAPTYTIANADYDNVGDALNAIDTTLDDALLWDADAGENGAFSAAHGKDKTASVITNVANGAISAASSDAINGSQLYTTNKYIADALGGDAEVNADGTITAPTYTIANAEYNNVGDALDALDDNALLWDETANGGAGAYNASHDGKASIITNVANGSISEDSTDAVNGSQLNATNMMIEQNTQIINQLAGNTDATYIQENGAGINYVRTNDDGLAFNDASAQGVGATAIGYNSVAKGDSSVAIGQGSYSDVDTGIALGSSSVSSRVIAKGSRDTSITENGVVIGYDTTDGELLGALSIGDDGKYRQIINVADGSEAHDAVTVRQLQNAIGAVATTPTKYFHANSTEEDSLAVGTDSLAMGAKTIVNGDKGIGIGYGAYVDANALNGIAIGSNAQVIHVNSIAIGNGSTTTRGAQTNYTAYNMDAPQNSVGEFSVGSADGQRQITNVAAGSADTDAVNVGQLKVTDAQVSQNTQSITNLDNRVTNLDSRVTNIENGIGDIVTTGSTKYFKTNTDGVDASAQGKDSVAIGSGSIAAADNSVALGTGSVATEENTISVGSSTNQRRITNVAAGKNATDAVNVAQLKSSEAGGVRYDTKADGSIDYSNITLGGGNGGTTRISNVSAGVNNNDVVNYAQLKQSVQETKQYTDQRMVEMDNKLSKTESKLSGGIASAMAMTGLPQAYTPGASMASIGGGTYNGESAVALGVSMVSANGRWVYKLQGSTNSQGEYSAALGAGIQW
ncbi:putative inner membrane protein [Escherichia coli 99.0815]|uniref:Inner membrane protein n=1 Tax=Escherichia coli 3.4880 TaxID=1051347 RepID=A0AAV3I0U5_ECOLX|nr:YadA-like family protein [Escherichia coli]EEX2654170.1 adhesin [Escherichia coli]EKK73122.1 hep Hag protein [Escherichia coli 8.0416]EKW70940.1 putative inner membrane protein [Escherichia coli 97.1742]ELV24543.1 putative inner membrane protein [Escherichia coli 99.0815]ELW11603.1 putative inner membrane protein [Escherichia coli 99.1781]